MDSQSFVRLWIKAQAILKGVEIAVQGIKDSHDPEGNIELFTKLLEKIEKLNRDLDFLTNHSQTITEIQKQSITLAAIIEIKKLYDDTRRLTFTKNGQIYDVLITSEYRVFGIPPPPL